MIGNIKNFRFWCQKVIPLVYDNSLSYYEVLCKVVHYLNHVIDDINNIPEYIDEKVKEAFDEEHIKELIMEVFQTLEDAISNNNEGQNTTFSKDYPDLGTLLWHDNKLYETIRVIDEGDAILEGVNIQLVNFGDMFNDFIDEVKQNFTEFDDDKRETASMDRPIHQLVWLDDTLYEVVKPIAEGNAYIYTGDNTNVEEVTMDSIYQYILNLIADEAQTRANEDARIELELGNLIASEVNTRASEDARIELELTNLINSEIGVVNNKIGDLTNLNTANKNNLVDAVNEILNIAINVTDFIKPEDYGAIGDGLTDDTSAMQAALNDGVKGIVLLTKQYKITQSLDISSNTTILGLGGVIIDASDSFAAYSGLLDIDNEHDILIYGVTIHGKNVNGVNRYDTFIPDSMIQADNCNNITIKYCNIVGATKGNAIIMRETNNFTISHCNIKYYMYCGIGNYDGGSNGIIEYCNVEFSRYDTTDIQNHYGITINGYTKSDYASGSNLKVIGNYIDSDVHMWEGIDAHGGNNVEIAFNTVLNMQYGIACVSNTTTGITRPVFTFDGLNVHDNYVKGYIGTNSKTNAIGSSGINISGSNVNVHDNRVDNAARYIASDNILGYAGISISESSSRVNITNNNISNCGGPGICINTSKYISNINIDGNSIALVAGVPSGSFHLYFAPDASLMRGVLIQNNWITGYAAYNMPSVIGADTYIDMEHNNYEYPIATFNNVGNCKPDRCPRTSSLNVGRLGAVVWADDPQSSGDKFWVCVSTNPVVYVGVN